MVVQKASDSLTTAVARDTLSAAIDGQRSAFAEIYTRCQPYCFGYFRSRLFDVHTANDLTQEVFLRLFRAISRFDLDQRFDAWIVGICRNVLREHIRKYQGRREVAWAEMCLDLVDTALEADGLYDDLLPLIPKCMSKLAPKSEAVVRAHYLEGKKIRELATKLDRTQSAVKMILLRARDAMGSCIRLAIQGKQV